MEEVKKAIIEGIKKIHEENQNKPNQYIVIYKKKDNDSILGYHLDSFCSLTKDILKAKRYSGDPDKQLAVIWKNLSATLNMTEEDTKKEGLAGLFRNIFYKTKQTYFKDIYIDDLYIDVVYLADETPKQNFSVTIIEPNG